MTSPDTDPSDASSDDNKSAGDPDESGSSVGTQFSYNRSRQVDREDRYGRVMRWVGTRPLSAGLAGGLAVVLVASLAAPSGIAAAPVQAGILSLMVVTIWAVLFYFMRDFFLRQSRREIEETYEFAAEPDSFRFSKEGEPEIALEAPKYELRVPPDGNPPAEQRPDAPARIWLVVTSRDGEGRFVLETKITAEEASNYPVAEDGGEADERLPIHLASGLLQLAERSE